MTALATERQARTALVSMTALSPPAQAPRLVAVQQPNQAHAVDAGEGAFVVGANRSACPAERHSLALFAAMIPDNALAASPC
jgi:hypothetical protein